MALSNAKELSCSFSENHPIVYFWLLSWEGQRPMHHKLSSLAAVTTSCLSQKLRGSLTVNGMNTLRVLNVVCGLLCAVSVVS